MLPETTVELTLPYRGSGEKKVRVYVPEHSEGELFPAVYMTDGQNVLDEETSTYGCWHTAEAVKEEIRKNGRGAVIVAIHNDGSPRERTNELTPRSIGKLKGPLPLRIMVRPDGESFDEFVMDTVIPEVEKSFPVKKGREFRAFCGSSSGGLQSFFTALSHPDVFSAAGVFSPAFTLYSHKDLTRWIISKVTLKMPYLYIYSGGGDKLEKKLLKGTEDICTVLETYYPRNRFCKVIKPEEKHHESAWEPVFRDFLGSFLKMCGE